MQVRQQGAASPRAGRSSSPAPRGRPGSRPSHGHPLHAGYRGRKGQRRRRECPTAAGKERGPLSAPHSPPWSSGVWGQRVGARAASGRAAGVGRQPGAHPPHPAAPPPQANAEPGSGRGPEPTFAPTADALTFSGGSDITCGCGRGWSRPKGWRAAGKLGVHAGFGVQGKDLGRVPWGLGFWRAALAPAGAEHLGSGDGAAGD